MHQMNENIFSSGVLRAAVLAGGLGTRLRSVVGEQPKPLAEVAGRPFLSYLLSQLETAGVVETVLCTGYRAGQVSEMLGNRYGNMRLQYSEEKELLGTAGALALARPFLGTGSVLVLNGDSYCALDLRKLVIFQQKTGCPGALALVEVEDTSRYGRVDLNGEGEIVSFREKGNTSGRGWINAGVYILSREIIESIPRGQVVSLEREIFPVWSGRGLCGLECPGPFLDIGTPESYARASEFFRALQI